MPLRITADLKIQGLLAYIPKVQRAAEAAPAEMVERVAAEWRSRAHVITGAYQASIGTMTHDQSEFSQRAADARARNPRAGIIAEPPRPQRKGAARVFAAVDYAVYEELGTAGRAAHPAFTPAVDLARREYPELVRKKLQP